MTPKKTFLCSCLVVILFSTLLMAQKRNTEKLGSGIPDTQRIAREVKHQLLLLPYYTLFDWLEFRVDGNKVTLTGEVTRPSLKSDTENAVKGIEGVESVQNNIEVLPLSPDDDRIRLAEYHAIYGFDGLYRYGLGPFPAIHILVKNGHVTLRGAVDSEADKNMAEIQAKSVPGVFSVQDDLTVTGSPAR
jgi:hyperosmotically inducible periplasmic protein